MNHIDNLAEIIRNLSPTVPLNRALWSAEDVGDYLRVSARTVKEKYATDPGFPKSKRIRRNGGSRGILRWKASEIIEWAEKQ